MTNFLYTGDNLHFLYRFNSESVDLIYLDPPFNSKRIYSAPIGSKAAGASFKDMWSWEDIDEELLATLLTTYPGLVDFIKSVRATHGKPMMAYVLYMAQRIAEMHRVLKDTGSIYLHVDPTASHYLKIVMDEIFGQDNFRNEIVWSYGAGGNSKKYFPRKHDIILFYQKSRMAPNIYTDSTMRTSYSESTLLTHYKDVDEDGRRYRIQTVNGKQYKTYADEGKLITDVWMDIGGQNATSPISKESTGYPTQKPLALLNRIIKASSEEGDLVLDPFCGCATTCVAAQQLGRKWIGIDIEEKAVEVLIDRLSNDAGLFKDFVHTHELPERTDVKIDPPSKSVREKFYKSQGGLCNGCKKEFELRNLEIDHIIPKSKGGSDTESNYQLLCGNCNRIKGPRTMEYLNMKLEEIYKLQATKITFGR